MSSSSTTMPTEELAKKKTQLYRQSICILIIPAPGMRLYYILRPIVEGFLVDSPNDAPMDTDELRDILDRLPAVVLVSGRYQILYSNCIHLSTV